MAGYIFNLDNINSLELYINNGIYATKLSTPPNYWKTHHEGTFADYITMKQGDNVYFFIDRKIYGIGELTNIEKDCKFLNFPEAIIPKEYEYSDVKSLLLWDEGEVSVNQRCICTFKPSPCFFENGIDMDDVLASNPSAFKMLRAFWKVSFMKFDDLENQAFRDVILRTNKEFLETSGNKFKTNFTKTHETIAKRLNKHNYNLSAVPILESCHEKDFVKHEMAIEAGLLEQIVKKEKNTIKIFGSWDYVTHQVIASPFKPIDYMDKMDIFGYLYLKEFKPTISKYLIIEIKKDNAINENIEQLLKYVDWVKEEYCHGDYSMIHSYLVAHEISDEVIEHKNNVSKRKYTIGRRPPITNEWDNLNLVKYSYNSNTGNIDFELIHRQI